ncbi:MAG: hypothetical protein J4F35_20390 [Candidatus Latescibacteria bacterium]|nr:hypothetical protein [Candidatus Latescibacterota bacterium]
MKDFRRFASFSTSFDLDDLLRTQRRNLWYSGALAVILLAALALIDPFGRVVPSAPHPPTVKYIKRQPRPTKPLSVRKIPQPKQQPMVRKRQPTPIRTNPVHLTANATTEAPIVSAVQSLVSPSHSSVPRPLDDERQLGAGHLLGERAIGITRQSENKIDLSLEMLDVNSLDTGQHQAVVIQDPDDPQSIKGFIKLPLVVPRNVLDRRGIVPTRIIDALADGINKYTNLRAEVFGPISFDDDRIFKFPLLIGSIYRGLGLNEIEEANQFQYLIQGGFIMGGVGDAEKHLSQVLTNGGLVERKDFWSDILPEDHPIYNAFFNIGLQSYLLEPHPDPSIACYITKGLKGHFIKDRLVYVNPLESSQWAYDEAELMLAINVMVYALAQEGSLAQRLTQDLVAKRDDQ